MNTMRKAAAGACLAALLAAVTACGTEDGTSAGAGSPGVRAGRTSAELHAAEAKREHATRADAMRWGHGRLAHHTRR